MKCNFWKHQIFKNKKKYKTFKKIKKKYQTFQTNHFQKKELRNPDFPFLMKIRTSKVKPCRALKNKKKIFVLSAFFLFLENKHFENHTHFTY